MIRITIAAFALLTPTLGSAEVYEDLKNGWRVEIEGGACFASTLYKNSDLFVVGYNPVDDRAAIMITDADATSLNEGDEVSLYVMFFTGRKLNEDWGTNIFSVLKHNGVSQMLGGFEGRRMIGDIARNDTIVFSIDGTTDRVVGAYKLDGSGAAMKSLRRCAFELHGLNPNDPFLP